MTYADPDMLVEPDWLQRRLDDPNLRLVDCDLPDQYRRAHLPGAVTYDVDHYLKGSDDRRYVMPPQEFAATMSRLGIGSDTDVVAYDASGGLYAARLWWCLNYYGFSRVKVLNGGWNRWLAEGRPVTMAVPPASPVPNLDLGLNPRMFASPEDVKAALQDEDVVVLDVRSDDEWDGKNDRGNRRAGHMPGAVHLEWLNNLSQDAFRNWKEADDLRQMFEAAGVTPDKEVVTVCQAGIRAAQSAFTLRLLGYPRVRVYDGSFFDWANRDDTPLV